MWEEYKSGMWESLTKEDLDILEKVIDFTGDHKKYGNAMMEVIKVWKNSCTDKLSNKNINRRAWIGHAACSYKFGWKESLVRLAWKSLTPKQRILANKEADKAIKAWEVYQIQKKQKNQLTLFDENKNRKIYKRLGAKML